MFTLFLIQYVTSVSMAVESSSLLRLTWDQLLQTNPNKNHCEGNLKTSLKSGWKSDFTNTISIAVETGSAQERPLSLHKNEISQSKAKTNTPTLSTRHWGTDYEAVHKTNHVPRTDNNSETTLRTFKLWSTQQGFFVAFTQSCLILALFQNLVRCFHFAL